MEVKFFMDVCAALMKADYGIEDEETLLAIKYHTTGRKEMTKLKNWYLLLTI